MPSFFAPQGKKIKSSSRPATSLFRRFNDLYKPSATLLSSFVPKGKPKSEKISQKQQKTLFNPEHSRVSYLSCDRKRFCRLWGFGIEQLAFRRRFIETDLRVINSELGVGVGSFTNTTFHPRPFTAPAYSTTSPGTQTDHEFELHCDAHKHAWCVDPAFFPSIPCVVQNLRASPDHHVSFLIPLRPDSPEPTPTSTSPTLHPLFSYIRPVEHAPISCDILYPPSSRTILDRSTRAPIAYETLAEPATEPPIYDQLVLRIKSDLTTNHFPWEIVVCPNAAGASIPTDSGGGSPRITRRKQSIPITNLDVLFALYDALSERVTEEEWARLGHRSRVQRQIGHAYERRCVKLGGGWEAGVRRIDWLDGRTRLVGIEMIHSHSKDGTNTEVATLVFKTPA
ncbi:hypothetical protein MSAN_00469000 [Mycena sanguinolenta]|uniref:DUF6699 domain-containing protein n=1 Tax=Mycena sanguinolenta TaxID=230812 RepID=A0A8H7DKL4_9AGAR|nr:hypothetical protein MSAN_00469000 [Mycena sanguinolenta]